MALNEPNGIEEAARNNDEPQLSPQEQVFRIDLAVAQIARSLDSLSDLRAFRGINSLCYRECLPMWRRKVIVTLIRSSRGQVTIQEFMETVYEKESIESYNVVFYSLPSVHHMSDEEMQSNTEFRFWKECGPHIKHLSLFDCNFDQRSLLNLTSNLAPNLESLKIQNGRALNPEASHEPWDGEHWKPNVHLKVFHVVGRLWFPSWMFMEYFPNLVDLKVKSPSDENPFLSLSALRNKTNFSILNLNTLHLIHWEQQWQGLVETNFPLEHLRLSLGIDATQENLQNLLTSLHATLKTLTLHQCPTAGGLTGVSLRVSFPSQVNLSNLTELHFWGRVVNNFNFLLCTPALKILVIDFMCHNMNVETRDTCRVAVILPDVDYSHFGDMVFASNVLRGTANFQHLNLEHLQIDFSFDPVRIRTLGKWMPNLKVLKTILDDTTLEMVCRQWTQLEQLHLLYGSEVTDEGITGLVCGSEATEGQVRKPNLTDLKELTHFGLDCYSTVSHLTETSVYNGFLEMPQLKTLTIYCSSRMSEQAEALLMENIPNAKVFRNYIRRRFTGTGVTYDNTGANFYFDPSRLRRIGRLAVF